MTRAEAIAALDAHVGFFEEELENVHFARLLRGGGTREVVSDDEPKMPRASAWEPCVVEMRQAVDALKRKAAG